MSTGDWWRAERRPACHRPRSQGPKVAHRRAPASASTPLLSHDDACARTKYASAPAPALMARFREPIGEPESPGHATPSAARSSSAGSGWRSGCHWGCAADDGAVGGASVGISSLTTSAAAVAMSSMPRGRAGPGMSGSAARASTWPSTDAQHDDHQALGLLDRRGLHDAESASPVPASRPPQHIQHMVDFRTRAGLCEDSTISTRLRRPSWCARPCPGDRYARPAVRCLSFLFDDVTEVEHVPAGSASTAVSPHPGAGTTPSVAATRGIVCLHGRAAARRVGRNQAHLPESPWVGSGTS